MPKKKTKKEIEESRLKASAKKFKNEVKKSTNTAIIAAFSFIIALSWRDLITEYVSKLTEISPISGKWIHALIVTFIGVIGIILVTKFLSIEQTN